MKMRIYTKDDFKKLKIAGKLASTIMNELSSYVKPGVTTLELNSICHDMILSNNAIPAPLGYCGYPKSICTSINEVVCHGIPSERKLLSGDIINIDITLILNDYYADMSRMFLVGNTTSQAKQLVDVTYQALMAAIEIVKPGVTLGDIGHTIESVVKPYKFSIVRDFCGHGTGKVFHEYPNVLHYGKPGTLDVLQSGNCFTIEPMINIGTHNCVILEDDWTAITADNSLSAQWEHTIGVTEDGVEIFTA